MDSGSALAVRADARPASLSGTTAVLVCRFDFSNSHSSSSPGLTGRSSTPRPIGSSTAVSGILDAPLEAGHDSGETRLRALAARIRVRAIQGPPSRRRGRRECRVLAATHGPRAVKKHGEGTTGSAESSGIPCATVYDLYAISPGTGLDCSRHSHRSSRCELGLSVGRPGPRDFAVRGYHDRPTWHSRPSHPASRFVTMRIRPSCRGGTARIMLLICGKVKRILENQHSPAAAPWRDGQS
jgi:hypothetical protein